MDLQFKQEQLTSELSKNGIGTAFQHFAFMMLKGEHSNLHEFKAPGADGGIDLVKDLEDGSRAVFECKAIEKPETAESRWKSEVAKALREHLKDPNGPTSGKPQFAPWYSTDSPIVSYTFCISSELPREEKRQELKQTILNCFGELAEKYPHLTHLKSIEVTVLDWNDFKSLLDKYPQRRFCWFPKTRPNGMVPLEAESTAKGFRAYLSEAKLPYYSLAEHIKNNPPSEGFTISDENQLLETLERGETPGLVIVGKGGIGKTRLMRELGFKALAKDWVVISVTRYESTDALEQLTSGLNPDSKLLLLIDYVETLKKFADLTQDIVEQGINANVKISYIATCRTGFYYSNVRNTVEHRAVDLSRLEDAKEEWFKVFRKQTVEWILRESGLPDYKKYLEVCNELPVLAVFASYLYANNKAADLAALLEEQDFGRWAAKRITMTFEGEDVGKDLAELMPLFPMPHSHVSKFESMAQRLFNRLAADGWIEKLLTSDGDAEEQWVTAHDVLADQILLNYTSSIDATIDVFISRLLELAVQYDNLESVIVSLQRVSENLNLSDGVWKSLIVESISKNQPAWMQARNSLLQTSLLSPESKLDQLSAFPEIWSGIEREVIFQNALGWLARRTLQTEKVLSDEHQRTLTEWIQKTISQVTEVNFLLTCGLKFAPDIVRDAALEWIRSRPALFQTHYLMVAWLNTIQESGEIADEVKQWCTSNNEDSHLSFVVRAWLDSGGELELVREPIQAWLKEHQQLQDAGFVYRSWLDRGGELDLVREPIRAWLKKHGQLLEAEFVYKSWLDRGGELDLVREPIRAWLEEHQQMPDARFVYKSWLDRGGELDLVREPIRAWLEEHQQLPEAQFVYRSWLDRGGELELVCEPIRAWLNEHGQLAEARFVLCPWLDRGGDLELVREPIRAWLKEYQHLPEARFVYSPWLDRGGEFELVREPIQVWLDKHGQQREASFVYNSWLKNGEEKELVWNMVLEWLKNHKHEEDAVYITKFISAQRDIPTDTILDILEWCRTFPENEDAFWRLTRLQTRLLNPLVIQSAVDTFYSLLRRQLSSTVISDTTKNQIISVFSVLNTAIRDEIGDCTERINELFLDWLRFPVSFGPKPIPHRQIQRAAFVRRVEVLLDSGQLDLVKDREPLQRFMAWFGTWEDENKVRASMILDRLRENHPAPDLWGTEPTNIGKIPPESGDFQGTNHL